MDFDKYINDNLLVVTPNNSKLYLLDNNKNLMNIKYMTIEEYKKHYFFSSDVKTISYLMTKYNYNLDICKIILNNLYVIDINKNYSADRLNLLKNIKIDLINNNLLYFDRLFNEYLKNKKVIVYNYDTLEKYEQEMLGTSEFINKPKNKINSKVVKCNTLEDELTYVCSEIIKLLNKGINLNNIYLSNVYDDDLYTIKEVFKYFNIPINIDMKESLYGTNLVKAYLESKKLPSFTNRISKKLIEVINSLVLIEDDPNYMDILIDKLKHTYLKPNKLINAVNIIDYKDVVLTDNDYLFIIGFNCDLIPKIYKDEDFISDKIKDEVALYKTIDKNIMEKNSVINNLSNVKNLYLSYRLKSNFNNYLPSTIIEDEKLIVEEYDSNKIHNSNIYNKILLGKYLDNYYKYGEINSNLGKLLNNYDIKYNTYDNNFTGIDNNKFIEFINRQLKLSYTSLNTYNNCGFKYYINYILKLSSNQDTFSMFIGNLFHHMFEVMYKDDFSFTKEWDLYLDDKELSISELFFLNNIKTKLFDAIEIIKKQELLTTYNEKLCEKEINIKIDKMIDVIFTGKIDKILYKKNINDTYYSIIDYKTGNVNTSINNMKYGLDMQLAIYLYLINKSDFFDNPIFTGIYFQRVLFSKYNFLKKKSLDDIKYSNLKLQGYSTDEINRLVEFDKSYENSELIKSMKINKDSSFSKDSKILSDIDIYNILKYTEEVISKTIDKILEGDFSINPKVIDKTSSCKYCEFSDICFVNNSNLVYLDSVNNLDFLEGDANGK